MTRVDNDPYGEVTGRNMEIKLTLDELRRFIEPHSILNNEIMTLNRIRRITGVREKEAREFYDQFLKPFARRHTVTHTSSGIVPDENTVPINKPPRKSVFDADGDPLPKAENPPMFLVGQAYHQVNGEIALVVGTSQTGSTYETVYTIDSQGNPVHRYNRRDFGRVTGSNHDNPDPRNFKRI